VLARRLICLPTLPIAVRFPTEFVAVAPHPGGPLRQSRRGSLSGCLFLVSRKDYLRPSLRPVYFSAEWTWLLAQLRSCIRIKRFSSIENPIADGDERRTGASNLTGDTTSF
jgi:hypothetical protein